MQEKNKFDVIAEFANAGALLSCSIMIMGCLILGAIVFFIFI